MKNPFESELERLARTLTEQFSVQVICQGDQAWTDGNKIVIPSVAEPMDEGLERMVVGYLDHEMAHVAFSDFQVAQEFKQKHPGYLGLLNVVEDALIERRAMQRWPGVRRNLDMMFRQIRPRVQQLIQQRGLFDRFCTAVYLWLSHHQDMMGLETELAGFEDLLDRFPQVQTTADAAALAEQLLGRWIRRKPDGKSQSRCGGQTGDPPGPPSRTSGRSGQGQASEYESGAPSSEPDDGDTCGPGSPAGSPHASCDDAQGEESVGADGHGASGPSDDREASGAGKHSTTTEQGDLPNSDARGAEANQNDPAATGEDKSDVPSDNAAGTPGSGMGGWPTRGSSLGPWARPANAAGWRPCWPAGKPAGRSTSGGNGYAGRDRITGRSGGTCVVGLGSWAAPKRTVYPGARTARTPETSSAKKIQKEPKKTQSKKTGARPEGRKPSRRRSHLHAD